MQHTIVFGHRLICHVTCNRESCVCSVQLWSPKKMVQWCKRCNQSKCKCKVSSPLSLDVMVILQGITCSITIYIYMSADVRMIQWGSHTLCSIMSTKYAPWVNNGSFLVSTQGWLQVENMPISWHWSTMHWSGFQAQWKQDKPVSCRSATHYYPCYIQYIPCQLEMLTIVIH